MPFFANLIVDNLENSSKFYQEVLGFQHIFTMPGPGSEPGLIHLRWMKYADLLITKPVDGKSLVEPRGVGVALNFQLFDHFGGDIHAFAEHVRRSGADITGPVEQPWNVYEVKVIDPDGYQLIFTQPVNTELHFDEMLERVVKKGDAGNPK